MRPLAALLLLLSFSTAAWFLLDTRDSGPLASPKAPGQDSSGSQSPLAALPSSDEPIDRNPAPTPRSEERTSLANQGNDDREELESSMSGAGFLVRVVRAQDQSPVQGAEIYAQSQDAFVEEDVMSLYAGTLSVDDLLTRDAIRVVTDRDGLAQIAAPVAYMILRGQKDDLVGMVQVDLNPEEPILLELSHGRPLQVEVRRVDGSTAAHFPLDLTIDHQQILRVFTGQEGRAKLNSALELSAQMFESPTGILTVQAGAPFAKDVTLDINLTEVQEAVPILQLPAFGTLQLEISGIEPSGPPTIVRLSVAPGQDPPQDIMPSPNPMDGLVGIADSDGQVEFPVGLGQRTLAVAWQQFSRDPDHILLDGPRYDGEVIKGHLDVANLNPIARLRILTPKQGESVPLANQVLQVLETDGASKTLGIAHNLRTDGQGFLRVNLSPENRGASLQVQDQGMLERPLIGEVRIPSALTRGLNELGDLILAPAPPLVAGQVVEEDGTPVRNAIVRWHSIAVNGQPARDALEHEQRTDTQGRFAFFDNAPSGRIVLTAARNPTSPRLSDLLCDPGQNEVELVLPPIATISVDLLASAPVLTAIQSRGALYLSKDADDSRAEVQFGVSKFSDLQDHGRAVFRGIEVGTYTLKLSALGPELGARPLRTGILVSGSSAIELDPIDLRGVIFAHRIEVFDPKGQPVGQARLNLRPAGEDIFPPGELRYRSPSLTVLSESPRIDVWAHSVGSAALEGVQLNVAQDIKLELVKSRQLQVQCPQVLQDAVPGLTFLAGIDLNGSQTSLSLFQESDRTTLPIPSPALIPTNAKLEIYLMAWKRPGHAFEVPGTRQGLTIPASENKISFAFELTTEEQQRAKQALAEIQ